MSCKCCQVLYFICDMHWKYLDDGRLVYDTVVHFPSQDTGLSRNILSQIKEFQVKFTINSQYFRFIQKNMLLTYSR